MISGGPPPARLDHAMCSIKIPVPSTLPQDKTTPPNHIKGKTAQAPKASHSGGSLSESSQSSSASFHTVTIIDPEDTTGSNFSILEAKEACVTEEEQVSGKLEGLSVREEGEGEPKKVKEQVLGKLESLKGEDCDWVSALFVFGGMDTTGIVHGDAFILVP